MKHCLFLIVFGTLSLMSLSPTALASVEEESTVNQPSFDQKVKEEGNENQQQKTNIVSKSRLELLVAPLHNRIASYLTQKETLNFAQVSHYCLNSLASQFSYLEITLENQNLKEETFLKYFGENGIYKEAQCLSLSGSSFHPLWLRHLPKTLKALKLSSVNTEHFSKFEFSNKSEMIIEIVKTLSGGTVPQLKFLDISKNGLRAAEAAEIAKHLTFLYSLDISRNNLGETGATEIAKLSSLSSLNISGNRLEDAGAAKIAKMTFLNSLDISWNNLRETGAAEIARHLTFLNSLDISWNNLGKTGATVIAKLSSLSSLNISGNQLEDAGAAKIAKMISLRFLNISENRISDEGARHIAKNLKSLTTLNISGNRIGDEGARHIAKNLTALIDLNISGHLISDEGARHIAKNLKSLKSLNISGHFWTCLFPDNNRIGDKGAQYIAKNLKSLTYLNLDNNRIGDKGARYLAQLPALKFLSFSSNLIRNEVIQELKEQFPRCQIDFDRSQEWMRGFIRKGPFLIRDN